MKERGIYIGNKRWSKNKGAHFNLLRRNTRHQMYIQYVYMVRCFVVYLKKKKDSKGWRMLMVILYLLFSHSVFFFSLTSLKTSAQQREREIYKLEIRAKRIYKENPLLLGVSFGSVPSS